jgi:hypothetical protein
MSDTIKNIARLRESANFLGYEFLSWLFLMLDHDDANNELSKITKDLVFKTEVKVVLGNKLVTCLFTHREQKTSVVNPVLEASNEIFASLRNGHVIESLVISIGLAEISIALTLHAVDFALTQVKIKNNYDNDALSDGEEALSEQDKNQEEIFLRLAAVEDTEAVVNGLFEHWLALRLDSSRYQKELMRMRGQIDQRLGTYITKHKVVTNPKINDEISL